jgi:hypothetical protein
MTLDPMNAYERHIIHAALQENGRVSTFSVGSEPNRRVVVAYGSNNQKRSSGTGRSERHQPRNTSNTTIIVEQQTDVTPSPSESEKTYREWS